MKHWLQRLRELGMDFATEASVQSTRNPPVTFGGKEPIPIFKKDELRGKPSDAYTQHGVIYLAPDITRTEEKEAVEHEKIHILLGHGTTSDEKQWLADELDAALYTYKRRGYPKSLRELLELWHEKLCVDWTFTSNDFFKTLVRLMRMRKGIPQRWHREFRELREELDEA